jgi:deoxyribose-phosphate aldolase
MKLNKMIDHTILKAFATTKDIEKLCEEAIKYDFKSVCVNPANVQLASDLLAGSDVLVCTVIGFPLGAITKEIKMLETIDAVKNGADEIDMVINSGKLKDGEYEYIVNDISAIKGACQGRALKVILETDLLSSEEIKTASELCIKGGADFVKTSTGFVKNGVGAKVEDVKLMYETVKDAGLGVKASGGVRDKEAAIAMIEVGATRIGTSSGVVICS